MLRVSPTDKALGLLPKVRAVLSEWNDLLTNGLTDEETALLTRLMARVRDKAEGYVGTAQKEARA